MKLYIKNMVCERCKVIVQQEFKNLGVLPISVNLGEVELKENLNEVQKEQLIGTLKEWGFELLSDRKSQTIERVKNCIQELFQSFPMPLSSNLSVYISSKLAMDYGNLSKLFSEVEGITIEKYFIHQKTEKAKELLVYEEWSVKEIAFQLQYSSEAHFSKQFKQVTGLSPSHFRQSKEIKRKSMGEV